jgi:hypothetical protein
MISLVISNEEDEKNIKNLLKFIAKSVSIELYSNDEKTILWVKKYLDYDDINLTLNAADALDMLYNEYTKYYYDQIEYLKCIFPDPIVDELYSHYVLPIEECIVYQYPIKQQPTFVVEYFDDIQPFSPQYKSKYHLYFHWSCNLINIAIQKLSNIVYKNINISLIYEDEDKTYNVTLLLHMCQSNKDVPYVIKYNKLVSNPQYYQNLLENNNTFLEYINLLYENKRINNINIKIN